jgi:hypothetical protein
MKNLHKQFLVAFLLAIIILGCTKQGDTTAVTTEIIHEFSCDQSAAVGEAVYLKPVYPKGKYYLWDFGDGISIWTVRHWLHTITLINIGCCISAIDCRYTVASFFYICTSLMPVRCSVFLMFVCALLLSPATYGQDEKPLCGFGVESNLLAGKIIKHTQKFRAPIPAISTAFDVNFLWQTYGKKEWHQRRNFPLVGFGIAYTDYGNDAIFGKCLGIYADVQLTILKRDRLEWTMRIGDGLGYVTKKYQTIAPLDTLNNAIGSDLNDFAIILTDLRYQVDDHWQLQLGANFTHISNGDFHQPNLGVNMVGAHVGVRYYPVSCKPKPIVRDLPKLKNRWLAQARAGVYFKEARAAGNPIYPSIVTSVYASKRWHGMNKFFAGVDYCYHNDVHAFLVNYGVHYGNEKAHSWDGGYFAGNEFLLGRVGLVGQVGLYYHQTYLRFDDVYEKLGGNFYFLRTEHGFIKELFMSAMLTTHAFTAEYADFGIGVGL